MRDGGPRPSTGTGDLQTVCWRQLKENILKRFLDYRDPRTSHWRLPDDPNRSSTLSSVQVFRVRLSCSRRTMKWTPPWSSPSAAVHGIMRRFKLQMWAAREPRAPAPTRFPCFNSCRTVQFLSGIRDPNSSNRRVLDSTAGHLNGFQMSTCHHMCS